MTRVLFALLAFIALTAFAPAPWPRRDAKVRDSIAHKDVIGNYRALELFQTNNGNVNRGNPGANGITHIVITQTQWSFNKGPGATTYDLQIDSSKKPAEINFLYTNQKEPYGRGIIRREGNKLRIIYKWGAQRPPSFENPGAGFWDLTIERE
jgi:hypothetical protein